MSHTHLNKKRERSYQPQLLLQSNPSPKIFINYLYETCYICNDRTKQDQFIQCQKCHLFFHISCYFNATLPNNTINYLQTCKFCLMLKSNSCVICQKEIVKQFHIEIECEFCGCKMHYNCIKLPLYLLLMRKYYSLNFEGSIDNKMIYNRIIHNLSQKENELWYVPTQYQTFIEIIKNNNPNYECLLQLFSVCIYCLKRHRYISNIQIINVCNQDKIFYLVNFFPFNQSIHELYINGDSYCKRNELDPNIYTKMKMDISQNEAFGITKILCSFLINETFSQKTIVKWKKGGYSIENHNFMKRYGDYLKLYTLFMTDLVNHDKKMYRAIDMDTYKLVMGGKENLTNYIQIESDKKKINNNLNIILDEIVVKSFSYFEKDEIKNLGQKPKYIIIVDQYKENGKKKWISILQSKLKYINIETLNLDQFLVKDKLFLNIIYNDTLNKKKELVPDILITSYEKFDNFIESITDIPINGYIFDLSSQETLATVIKLIKNINKQGIMIPFFYVFFRSDAIMQLLIEFNKVIFDRKDSIIGYFPFLSNNNIFNYDIKLLPQTLNSYINYAFTRLGWKIEVSNINFNYQPLFIDIKNYVAGEIALNEGIGTKKIINFIPVKNSIEDTKVSEYTLEMIEGINDISNNHNIKAFGVKSYAIGKIIRKYNKNENPFFVVTYSMINSKIVNSGYIDTVHNFNSLLGAEINKEISGERFSIINIEDNDKYFTEIHQYKMRYSKVVVIFYNVLVFNGGFLKMLHNCSNCDCYQLYCENSIEQDILYAYYTYWYSKRTKIIQNKNIITSDQVQIINRRRKTRFNSYPIQSPNENIIYSQQEIDGILIFDRNIYVYTINGNFFFDKFPSFIESKQFVKFKNNNVVYYNSNNLNMEKAAELSCEPENRTDKEGMIFYLMQIIHSQKASADKITLLHSFLIQNGLIMRTRKYLLSNILKYGINFDNLLEQVQNVTTYLKNEFIFDFQEAIINFYFEYFLLSLDNSESNPVIDNFLFFNENKTQIKEKLLVINLVRMASMHDRLFFRNRINGLLKQHKETIYKILPEMDQSNENFLDLVGEGILIIFEESHLNGFDDYNNYISDTTFIEKIISQKKISQNQFYKMLFGKEISQKEFCVFFLDIFTYIFGEILIV